MTNTMTKTIENIKEYIKNREFEKAEQEIKLVLDEYPHTAIPYNLYGILFEKKCEHVEAMKHFRAAYALDPTYLPARYNMEQYENIDNNFANPAFDENDCIKICDNGKDNQFVVKYDSHHIGHIVRK